MDSLGDAEVGCMSSGKARAERDEAESVRQESEGEEGARPALGCISLCFFALYFPSLISLSFVRRLGKKEKRQPQYDPEWLGTGKGHVLKKPAASCLSSGRTAAMALRAACSGIVSKRCTTKLLYFYTSRFAEPHSLIPNTPRLGARFLECPASRANPAPKTSIIWCFILSTP